MRLKNVLIKGMTTALAVMMIVAGVPVGKAQAAETLTWPVPGYHEQSRGFSSSHTAIDICNCNGKDIVAAQSGTVDSIYKCTQQHYGSLHDCDGFGTGLIIKGGDGRYYIYAHMTAGSIPESVYKGATVSAGQKIGMVGTTGNSSGPHLHFGIALNAGNKWSGDTDPMNYTYSDNNLEGTPGALTISAKSSYYSTEDVVVSWNTPSNTAKYGFTLRHNPSTGDLVDHYVTGNSYNLGKLAAGNYRLWMAPYNSSGTRGTAVYVDFTVVSHSHSYTSKITKNPTCAATGVRTYTCACGSSYTETIAKTAHKLSYKVTKAATCVTTGIGTYTCTCGLSYTETIAKTSHTAVTDAAVAATCTQAGKTAGSHCKVCNTVIMKQETIPAKGHTIVTDAAVAATCTQAGKTTGSHCKVCNLVVKKQEIIPRKPHNYTSQIIKATTKKNGSISSVCSTCGTKDTSTIYMPKKLELSKKNCEYTGKACKPSVVVKDSKGNVIDSSNYTVTYSKNKSVGKASVKVTFKGDAYSGNLQQTFTITPKKTSISKVTAKSKGFSLQWKMQKTQVTGYEIQYSTNKSFTKGTTKTVTVEKNTTKAKTITKLKAKQKYYVKVRTYKTVKVNGKNTKIYSDWSKAKTVTTKK